MNEVQLLPCPFCGSIKIIVRKLPKIDELCLSFSMIESSVECIDCGADGPKRAFVKDVSIAWNTRINIKEQ